jgi:hypothetical protein
LWQATRGVLLSGRGRCLALVLLIRDFEKEAAGGLCRLCLLITPACGQFNSDGFLYKHTYQESAYNVLQLTSFCLSVLDKPVVSMRAEGYLVLTYGSCSLARNARTVPRRCFNWHILYVEGALPLLVVLLGPICLWVY